MSVERVEILPKVRFNASKPVFEMISPLYLKTMQEKEGKLVEWDLYPRDGKFYENLHQTLVRKYTEFHGKGPGQDYFDARPVGSFKAKRHLIKGNSRRCSLLKFRLDTPEELARFGYEAGFGEKTAMGFGCVEVVEG